jgi:hypothetical protein
LRIESWIVVRKLLIRAPVLLDWSNTHPTSIIFFLFCLSWQIEKIWYIAAQ